MRRALVAGNWKMNGSAELVSDLLSKLITELGDGANALDVVVCPPFPYLAGAQRQLRDAGIALGAQNAWYEVKGAFTGEVSPAMLADFGVSHVLLGHSERRTLLGEDDALVARKFAAVQAEGQCPVLCIGETLEEREQGAAEEVVTRQLEAVLGAVGPEAFNRAVVAYEPVWAIGTGETATPRQAQEMHQLIRRLLAAQDAEMAARLRIVYGGSVNADNAGALFAQPDIDGGLVGGASLDARTFTRICNSVS